MYIVIELQTNGGQTANIVTAHADLNSAESQYHSILASAAVSSVEIHAAVLISDEGFPLKNECYKHTPSVEPDEGGSAE